MAGEVTRLLRRVLGRDEPPTLMAQMRNLWPKEQTARVIYAKSDGRERLTTVFRVLSTVRRAWRQSA